MLMDPALFDKIFPDRVVQYAGFGVPELAPWLLGAGYSIEQLVEVFPETPQSVLEAYMMREGEKNDC